MKINNKILSIPPYISTYWSNISALHMRGESLVANLMDGEAVEIPGLDRETIENIFHLHACFIEEECTDELQQMPQLNVMQPFAGIIHANQQQPDPTIRFSINTLDDFGSVLQHNSSLANTPDIPKDILDKITAVTKLMTPEDMTLPKAEPHCNCTFCQIARALGQEVKEDTQWTSPESKVISHIEKEETILDKELHFQQWEIQQNGEQLFTVINRLETQEKYSVFLGNPVGCTCGIAGCEHIIAVLKS